MGSTVLILVILAFAFFIIAARKKDGSHTRGLTAGAKLFYSYLPLLILAFLAAGLLQVALPAQIVSEWLGAEAGWRGILIGSFAGMLVAAGPYVSFPIFASILQGGAGIGTTVALVTSWCLLTFSKLPFELAVLGPRFSVVRITIVALMPIIAGFLAHFLFAAII